MARQYVSNEAVCPFYLMEDRQTVTCEGVGPGWVIKISRNVNSGNAKDYIREFCYRDWEKCRVAQMLQKKYQ